MPLDPAQRHQIEQDAITAAWEAAHDQKEGRTMTKLTETQIIVLTAGAKRPDNIALPLPKGLAGAAAKMAVAKMMEHGWLEEVDANTRRGEPLWRETGDGHGTTLVVTDAGLLAIGIDPVVVKTVVTIRKHAVEAKKPTSRAGTKQAMLIALLKAPQGVTMEAIIAATGWRAHTARGAMSGALGMRLGLTVTSSKEDDRGRVYRIGTTVQQTEQLTSAGNTAI